MASFAPNPPYPNKVYALTLAKDGSTAEIEKYKNLTDHLEQPSGLPNRLNYQLSPGDIKAQLSAAFGTAGGPLQAYVTEDCTEDIREFDDSPPKNDKITVRRDSNNSNGKNYNIMLPSFVCERPDGEGDPEFDLSYLDKYINYLADATITNDNKQRVLFGLLCLSRCR